ncbi:MAG TPA: hypothetical protein PKA28_01670 [Methylomusa anaerophila]|nr:hypothetical protein [Methylomusa anaerophila]HML87140.1 hypothetical protein [Methylomusa anaerophila]
MSRMRLHFSPLGLGKRRLKRFYKRLEMDTGMEWDIVSTTFTEAKKAGI